MDRQVTGNDRLGTLGADVLVIGGGMAGITAAHAGWTVAARAAVIATGGAEANPAELRRLGGRPSAVPAHTSLAT